jgi:hypothetical protein
MYPKVGLAEETKGGGKERKTVNNYEIHTCVGTRHSETRWKLLNNTGWGKERGSAVEGGYIDLGTMHVQV